MLKLWKQRDERDMKAVTLSHVLVTHIETGSVCTMRLRAQEVPVPCLRVAVAGRQRVHRRHRVTDVIASCYVHGGGGARQDRGALTAHRRRRHT